jgi:hypothetical protein
MLHAVNERLLSYCENVYSSGNINQKHGFGGVIVGVLASSAVDRGFEPRRVKPRAIKLVFVASSLRTQHCRERAKIGWLRTRIMCPNAVAFLPAECCFSELAL